MFWLFEFIKDMVFIVKIFVLLAIVSFIINHLGKGPLAIVLIMGFTYFMIFSPYAWFFEGTYVLMMLLMFGLSSVLIDLFFVGGMAGGGEASPMSHGGDLAGRVAAAGRGRQMAQGMTGRFRGR